MVIFVLVIGGITVGVTGMSVAGAETSDAESASLSGAVCFENWRCSSWSSCADGLQFRECSDVNACGTERDMPALQQECVKRKVIDTYEFSTLGNNPTPRDVPPSPPPPPPTPPNPESTSGAVLLEDSPCERGWPWHEGEVVVINEQNYACDLFEVTHPSLHEIAREALECCSSGCGPECHDYCVPAYTHAGFGGSSEHLKRCSALYLVYGLGPAREWMQDYFAAEFACSGSLEYGCAAGDEYTCGCSEMEFSPAAEAMSCNPVPVDITPRSWLSDVNFERNNCYLSDVPAHASIILGTGTCVDYSVMLTSLLRIVGYGPDEIYSVMGDGHEYNLVKLPGEKRWNVVDTNENNPIPYVASGLPSTQYDYCDYHDTSCANDNGQTYCPPRDSVKGCDT